MWFLEQEQLLLEKINQARIDPGSAAASLSIDTEYLIENIGDLWITEEYLKEIAEETRKQRRKAREKLLLKEK